MSHTNYPVSRREFCKRTLAATGSIALGLQSPYISSADSIDAVAAFASSFADVPEKFGPTRVLFDKPLPDGLAGTLYRNGPARMARGDSRYHHWFDGDGMVHSFQLQQQAVVHRAAMVETERAQAEARAGRFLYSGFGTTLPDSLAVSSPDDLNVGNISVLPLGDEILALWEAGSAWRLDAQSLDTLGRKVFSDDTDGLSFSAHPRIDRHGKIWNFGYLSGSGKLVLYELESDGQLSRVSTIDAPNADMVHDFAMTEQYLVFVLQPLHLQPSASAASAFMEQLHWDADGAVHILVVDKQSLQTVRRFELPPFFTFHLGNAWQDRQTIHIEVATAADFKPLMRQIVQATTATPLTAAPSQPRAMDIVLNLASGAAQTSPITGSGVDFPRFDQRFTGSQTRHLFMLGRSDDISDSVFGFNRVCSMDRVSGVETVFDYNAHTIAEEHVFVPQPGAAQGQGWLIGTSYDWQARRSSLAVFDARRIQHGPVAQARLPYPLPLGLHGQFVAA